MPAAQAPAGEARDCLVERRTVLRASLSATPGPELTRTLTLLLAASREFGALAPKDAAVRVALYAEALAGIPVWAVERARRTFGRGGWRCLWDGRDVPASSDVVAECRAILLPIETELARLDAVLDAELITAAAAPGEREASVGRWWEEIRPGFAGSSTIAQRTDAESAAEAEAMAGVNARFRERDRIAAAARGRGQASWGRLPISDELARKIGLAVPPAGEGAS